MFRALIQVTDSHNWDWKEREWRYNGKGRGLWAWCISLAILALQLSNWVNLGKFLHLLYASVASFVKWAWKSLFAYLIDPPGRFNGTDSVKGTGWYQVYCKALNTGQWETRYWKYPSVHVTTSLASAHLLPPQRRGGGPPVIPFQSVETDVSPGFEPRSSNPKSHALSTVFIFIF